MGKLILVMILSLENGVTTFYMGDDDTIEDCQAQGEELLLTDRDHYAGYVCVVDNRDSSI
jgi:hypothetical protein